MDRLHALPRPIFLALFASAALLGACAKNGSTASANPGCPHGAEAPAQAMAGHKVSEGEMGSAQQVSVVNAYCPVAGSHGVGKARMQSAALTREYKGQRVGFCCDHCLPVWDKMTDQQRQAALDAVARHERSVKQ